MKRHTKRLRLVNDRLRGLVSLGALERSRAEMFATELRKLAQALDVGDQRRVEKAIDAISRLFVRDVDSK